VFILYNAKQEGNLQEAFSKQMRTCS